MSGIVLTYNNELDLIFTIVVLTGLIQILFGILRIGKYIQYVPSPVISGFVTGIGCIIIITQFGPIMGHQIQGKIFDILQNLMIINDINNDSLIVGMIGLIILIIYPRRFDKFIPSPLICLFIGILLSYYLFTNAIILREIPVGLPGFISFKMPLSKAPFMLFSAFTLALLGSVDSLITSLIADKATNTKHNSNKELIGQGIGNTISGLFGALPGAGATMRTMVNIKSGGQSNLSGMIHALLLLGVVLGLAPLAEIIPNSILAGILIKIGWGIIDWDYIKNFKNEKVTDYCLMLFVLFFTVFVDLIIAVFSGIILYWIVNMINKK
jgi:SulP family sulfate permease